MIAGLFVWFFAEALFGGGVFVFRDSGHYYYPLLKHASREWAAGRIPLWNPYENLGVPLAANGTTGAFYPGSLLFALPLDFPRLYNAYVMAHVLLAAGAAYHLARRFGGSVEAAGVGALSYAFCGNVLFQYCNVVFLVGAAWLPLAVAATDRMLTRRSLGAAVGLGIVLAMITLGGNAELAYHAGLMAAMYAVWLWWADRREGCLNRGGCRPEGERMQGKWPVSVGRLSENRIFLLTAAAVIGLVLAAVQVIPSVEFCRRSGRAASIVPRTLYEIPGYQATNRVGVEHEIHWTDGLTCRRLEPGTHHEHVYHFSVGPWRLAETVWPNFGGRQFPVHRRWMEAIPAEGRVWAPSLYMGLIPLFVALAGFRLRGGTVRQNWLSWLVVMAVLGAFGWYGLGWLARELRVASGGELLASPRVGAPVGGLYWLMTVALPGYIHFRYPAKLLVIAALALSMLAAVRWDRTWETASRPLAWASLGLGVFSLMAGLALFAGGPLWSRWLGPTPPNVLFGPFDLAGAHTDLVFSLLQTAAIAGGFWWLLCRAKSGRRWVGAVALGLVAVDLGVANGWMVACAPAGLWEESPQLAERIEEDRRSRGDEGPYRVFRRPIWMPERFALQGSPNRLAEAMQWDRDTLWPKYNLAPGVSVAEVEGTMKPYDYQVFLWAAKQAALRIDRPSASRRNGTPCPLTLLPANVQYVITRGQPLDPLEPVEPDRPEADVPDDVALWYNPGHLPRAWIVHQVDVLEPPGASDPLSLWEQADAVLFDGLSPRDFRRSAVVETELPLDLPAEPKRPVGSVDGERCRVVGYAPSCVEIEAELARPGLVVLCDQFYPGWQLDVETGGSRRTVPILRTNRVMRGAWLPAGQHRLIYRYRPASFRWGAVLSLIGATFLAAVGIATALRRLRKH